MDIKQQCCWVPAVATHLFECCRSTRLTCCNGESKAKPAVCVDTHPTCPLLKKQIDAAGKSCYKDDMGVLTHDASLLGMHLADKCCASCCNKRCRTCVTFAPLAQCSAMVGENCTCATVGGAASATGRRRAQAGNGKVVATQVGGQESSRRQLAKLTSCLRVLSSKPVGSRRRAFGVATGVSCLPSRKH